MKISRTTYKNRKAWTLENDVLALVILEGGGHIASVARHDHPKINPLWQPVWKGLEPWEYNAAKHGKKYELQLLAAICGHNVCLGWFGDSAESEKRYGLGPHGEAPVARWKKVSQQVSASQVKLTLLCEMPKTGMDSSASISPFKQSTAPP